MALSDDRIYEIAYAYGALDSEHRRAEFARAIEAEVRKEDTELIRQMWAALSDFDYDKRILAIAAANARLEGKP